MQKKNKKKLKRKQGEDGSTVLVLYNTIEGGRA
jgi:hypothetical protein